MTARLRNQDILDVFPPCSMFFQVDLNGNLAALLIGDELDSVMVLLSPQLRFRRTLHPLFRACKPYLSTKIDHFVGGIILCRSPEAQTYQKHTVCSPNSGLRATHVTQ